MIGELRAVSTPLQRPLLRRFRSQATLPSKPLVAALVVLGIILTPAQARDLSRVEIASHVFNRLAFGPRPTQVVELRRRGWQKWVEEQLQPGSIEASRLKEYLARECPSLALSLTELQQLARAGRDARRDNERRIRKELEDSVLMRAVYSQWQLQEVLVEFWRNHFNVDVKKVPFLATHYEEHVLRSDAFGKFEDLLLATARHPAMLVYLDNYVSRAGGINENYARELMELHTVGVDNGYTQDDVVALARTLTGWTCGWHKSDSGEDVYGYYFAAGRHDKRPARIMDCGVDGTGGEADGERVLRYLARHENTAHFISTKLCRYLLHDQPSEEIVQEVADVFQQTGGDLPQVYRAILFGSEFVDTANYRAKFKTPFEFLISTLRCVDAQIDSTAELKEALKLMGQPVYACEDPTGYDDRTESWLDPGVMIYRWDFAMRLVSGKVKGVKIGPAFLKELSRPARKPSDRVMLVILPGAVDTGTEEMLSRTNNAQVMVALALGSPGFQQQ